MRRIREFVPTSVTLLAMLCGFISILVTVEGIHTSTPALYKHAALLIMLAMILDGLDGNLARWLKAESEFGGELDTYVDLTAFGLAPAILVFAVAFENKEPVWRVLLPSAVALSGVVRLARFKASDPLRGQGGYAGLPITANAGWVAMFVYISQVKPSEGAPAQDPLSLQHGWFATAFLLGVVTFIVLQVTNFHYPKPTKRASLFSVCVMLVVSLFVMAFLDQRLSVVIATIMLVLGAGYAIFGPLFVKGVAAHKARKAGQVGDGTASLVE